jgi:hypothetical protein
MLQPGGGVNLKINQSIGVVGQVDYRRVFLDEEGSESGKNHFRIGVGLRFGF